MPSHQYVRPRKYTPTNACGQLPSALGCSNHRTPAATAGVAVWPAATRPEHGPGGLFGTSTANLPISPATVVQLGLDRATGRACRAVGRPQTESARRIENAAGATGEPAKPHIPEGAVGALDDRSQSIALVTARRSAPRRALQPEQRVCRHHRAGTASIETQRHG